MTSFSGIINALDFCGNKIQSSDIAKAESMLKLNFGKDYPEDKFKLLWSCIKEDNWTNERLIRTVKWFLKNQKYRDWVIADFYNYKVELHNYDWALAENNKSQGAFERMLKFKINGKVFFCYDSPDAQNLPLEKIP